MPVGALTPYVVGHGATVVETKAAIGVIVQVAFATVAARLLEIAVAIIPLFFAFIQALLTVAGNTDVRKSGAANFAINATTVDIVVDPAFLSDLVIAGTALPVTQAFVAVSLCVRGNGKRTIGAEIATAAGIGVRDAV